MERKAYGHILRNKLLFNWVPALRSTVYRFYRIREAPVFVLGNQKSGTSAIAALLARACGLSYDIDLGGLRVGEYERIYADPTPQTLREVLRDRATIETSKAVVKEPNLTFLAARLRALHPRARHVFIVRDPRANIRSICNRLKLPGHLASVDTADFPEISPMWEAILYNRWVGDPTLHLNYIGRSAERWRSAADGYAESGPETCLIRYEDFVNDKLGAIANLADDLGLEVTADITPYIDVQYQTAGRKVTDYTEFFGEANLATIHSICEPAMARLGYSTQRV